MILPLWNPVTQFEYLNGSVLVGGSCYVYFQGRTRLATVYKDENGTVGPNPARIDANGRVPVYVDSNYTYTVVFCDARGKELFSQDLAVDDMVGVNDLGDDAHIYIVEGDHTIQVSATSGLNWTKYALSTYNKPLGVIEPLYWHQDDEEASIIGLHTDGLVSGVSADLTELSGKVNELSANKMDKSQSAEFYPSNNPSGFISDADLSQYAKKEELTAYQSAGDYYSASNPSGFINSDAISDMATTGFVANVSADITAMIPTALTGDYLTKESADTLYQPIGDYVNQNELSNVSADITAMIPTAMTGDYLDKASADKLYYGIDNPSGFITGVDLTPYQTVTGMTAYQTAGNYYSASNPSGFITNDAITGLQPSGDYVVHDELTAYATTTIVSSVSSTITGMIPSGEYELVAGSGIELVDDPNAKTTTISVTAQGSNTISYSAKPTADPIYASGNDLKNVNSIQGKSNLAIVPNGVLQVPNVITAVPNGVLNVPGVINSHPGGLTANGLSANSNGLFANGLSANSNGLTTNGLSANANYGLTANGLTADAENSSFSAIGISAGKQGPFIIQGSHESISSNNKAGFIFSSDDINFNSATLTTAGSNNTVGMPSPKFEARNISGAGFSIEASGAKGYNESGNVVWDTNNPQVKNIISYGDTKTAQGGLNGNIILTTQPSTAANNLTSSPYVIMDAAQASYFAAYGPSAQTPTINLKPDAITFDYAAGNAKTTVGYNDVKQELSGSSWTLTGSIQKRELEYDANTSAITAIAGSALAGGGEKQEVSHDNTLSGNGTVNSPLGVNNEYIKLLSVRQPLTAVVQNYEATASIPDGYEFLCWVNMCTNGFSQIYYPLTPTSAATIWWLGGSMTNPGPGDSVDSRYLVVKKA